MRLHLAIITSQPVTTRSFLNMSALVTLRLEPHTGGHHVTLPGDSCSVPPYLSTERSGPVTQGPDTLSACEGVGQNAPQALTSSTLATLQHTYVPYFKGTTPSSAWGAECGQGLPHGLGGRQRKGYAVPRLVRPQNGQDVDLGEFSLRPLANRAAGIHQRL